jgi:hypothetical protein
MEVSVSGLSRGAKFARMGDKQATLACIGTEGGCHLRLASVMAQSSCLLDKSVCRFRRRDNLIRAIAAYLGVPFPNLRGGLFS